VVSSRLVPSERQIDRLVVAGWWQRLPGVFVKGPPPAGDVIDRRDSGGTKQSGFAWRQLSYFDGEIQLVLILERALAEIVGDGDVQYVVS
jgi:hypothetical protein